MFFLYMYCIVDNTLKAVAHLINIFLHSCIW